MEDRCNYCNFDCVLLIMRHAIMTFTTWVSEQFLNGTSAHYRLLAALATLALSALDVNNVDSSQRWLHSTCSNLCKCQQTTAIHVDIPNRQTLNWRAQNVRPFVCNRSAITEQATRCCRLVKKMIKIRPTSHWRISAIGNVAPGATSRSKRSYYIGNNI